MEYGSDSQSLSSDGNPKSEVQLPETPEELVDQVNSTASSEKQYSIFSLTIGEIQNRSGRSLGSMNIDEFLNSVWIDHEYQASSNASLEVASHDSNGMNMVQSSLLRRQGSSLSVPIPLCGKTVDEVWASIQQHDEAHQEINTSDYAHFVGSNEALQLQTLGEMTLEEFLIKAGVVRQGSNNPDNSQQEIPESDLSLSNQNRSGSYFSNSTCVETNNTIIGSAGSHQMMGFEFSAPSSCVGNGNGNALMSNASSVYHLLTLSSGGCSMGEPSNSIRHGRCTSPTAGESSTKRKLSPPMEAAIERRQRRMIKNRESAARSRARKQAYTAELEIELNQVREENERLRLALEEAEKKLNHEGSEAEWPMKKKHRTIRRTTSTGW